MTTYTYVQLNSLYQAANGLSNSSHTQIMAALAEAESSGNPNARNPSGASGLWQIMPSHVHDSGWTFGSNFFDPATNARMAEFVYQHQGYTAWTTFSSGAYKKFLGGSVTDNTGFNLPNIPNPLSGLGNALSGADDALNAFKFVLDVGFWKRIGIGAIGVFLILIGIIVLLRKPIESATTVAASVIP